MKAFFKSKKSINKKHFQRIEQELEHNDSKRTDMKRVLLRFNKEQQMGFRLEQTQSAVIQSPPLPDECDFKSLLDKKMSVV